MGCGPLLRVRSDCTTVTANLNRSIPAFRTPSAATRRLPRFAEKGGPAGGRFGVACLSYCLTPNHVHLILTPDDPAGLALARLGRRLHAGFVSARRLRGAAQPTERERDRFAQRPAGVERGPPLFAERLGLLAARDGNIRI
jgi:hypothetical protein